MPLTIESLDPGTELGLRDIVECCHSAMEEISGDLECSNCGSTVTLDARRTVVDLTID